MWYLFCVQKNSGGSRNSSSTNTEIMSVFVQILACRGCLIELYRINETRIIVWRNGGRYKVLQFLSLCDSHPKPRRLLAMAAFILLRGLPSGRVPPEPLASAPLISELKGSFTHVWWLMLAVSWGLG